MLDKERLAEYLFRTATVFMSGFLVFAAVANEDVFLFWAAILVALLSCLA